MMRHTKAKSLKEFEEQQAQKAETTASALQRRLHRRPLALNGLPSHIHDAIAALHQKNSSIHVIRLRENVYTTARSIGRCFDDGIKSDDLHLLTETEHAHGEQIQRFVESIAQHIKQPGGLVLHHAMCSFNQSRNDSLISLHFIKKGSSCRVKREWAMNLPLTLVINVSSASLSGMLFCQELRKIREMTPLQIIRASRDRQITKLLTSTPHALLVDTLIEHLGLELEIDPASHDWNVVHLAPRRALSQAA